MTTVIELKNISKQYRLGKVGTGTLRNDFKRWIAKVRGKEDPFLKIGTENRLDSVDGEYVWALKDINLEVKQGEVLGIIGKNGAGKSTLLKLLSRVTSPTTGEINVRGRIASLLEVGTGFNPDLTGRENIFLNGAILGMTKIEIKSKFDEIVDFSGVEKYIDTPVKRYSSGMYVRLAFAVAAHLDPEILVVDEVLAVGDAEFQKKALGKMQSVAGEGRTVLFVSHNMSAINTLCNKGIVMFRGGVIFEGAVNLAINKYLEKNETNYGKVIFTDRNGNFERNGQRQYGEIISLETIDKDEKNIDTYLMGEPFYAKITVQIKETVNNPEIGLCISTPNGSRLHHLVSKWATEFGILEKGIYEFQIKTTDLYLYPGKYTLTVWFRNFTESGSDDFIESPLVFNIIQSDITPIHTSFKDFSPSGGVYLKTNWDFIRK